MKIKYTRIRTMVFLRSFQYLRNRTFKISIEKESVKTVIVPSALGNKAETKPMMKIHGK
ncbi:MAG: hypothetical protein ACMUEM_07555 [Flavobacteriales bacterium AspAUS03]